MNHSRPGILAVRAVNQYRRRDALPYLGLRYYLHNKATRTDAWARHVATHLVLTRGMLPYFRAYHFKEIGKTKSVEHRPLLLPGPNEALAEAALFEECSKCPSAFANPACVFSYGLSSEKERAGVFEHYFIGLRARQLAVAKACDDCPGGVVQYTDIRRFYPSIQSRLVQQAWRQQAETGKLSPAFRILGEKLIDSHANAALENEAGVLTGPMFSHLLGNLVLRTLDQYFSENLSAKYFRYVDDIIFVGESAAVHSAHSEAKARLLELGFQLHDQNSGKHLEVPAEEWLGARNDYHEGQRGITWKTLIGDLKRFLLLNPKRREELQRAFRHEGFRLPIQDYSSAVHEAGFLDRILSLASQTWFRRKARVVSIEILLEQARQLRKRYEMQFRRELDQIAKLSPFNRKRVMPKLRYRASRLIYLAEDDALASLSRFSADVPELFFHSKVMAGIASRNIDQLLGLGTNAGQAAAQALRASGERVEMTRSRLSTAEEQALAVFLLNGVPVVQAQQEGGSMSQLMRFTTIGADRDLMNSNDPFIREIACLHGLAARPRHPDVLESVFDEDEDLAMDAIDQLQQSISA